MMIFQTAKYKLYKPVTFTQGWVKTFRGPKRLKDYGAPPYIIPNKSYTTLQNKILFF
jgi:hypothetical protein